MFRSEYVVLLLILLLLTGCSGDMVDQERYDVFEPADRFENKMSARPLVEGVVPREAIIEDTVLRTGLTDTGDFATTFPLSVNSTLLQQGQTGYETFCAPCHGISGYGNGMIVQRGYPAAPSFHEDRLRTQPNGYYFDVITNGFGIMYDYAARVKVRERWAIIAYIRTLQLSQSAPAETLSSEPQEQSGQ